MFHDVRFTQNPQMLADERLTAAKGLYQLVNEVVTLRQKMDYLQAGGGVEGLKYLGRTSQLYGINESYRRFMLVSMGEGGSGSEGSVVPIVMVPCLTGAAIVGDGCDGGMKRSKNIVIVQTLKMVINCY